VQEWKFWDWVAYGCLAIAALTEAGEAGIKQAPTISATIMPELLKTEWLAFIPLILVVVATVILLISHLRPRSALKERRPGYRGTVDPVGNPSGDLQTSRSALPQNTLIKKL